MKPIFVLALALVASVAAVPTARAQADVAPVADVIMAESNGAKVSLAEAVRLAWQRALASRAALGQRQRAEAEKHAAFLPWADAPSLEITHWNDRWQTDAGQQESEVGLAWPLLMPGQGSARRADARAGLVQAEAAERLALLQLSREVQESAWALVALHTELAQAESNLATLSALADDVERRVRVGDLARADALVAR
ncbi:MAG: TolC family protein, partial [Moraxellaceae bacterium]